MTDVASLSAIFRHTPAPTLVLDVNQVVQEVSDSYLRLRNYERHDCIGHTAYDMAARVSVQYAALMRDTIQQVVKSRQPQRSALPKMQDQTLQALMTPIEMEGEIKFVVISVSETSCSQKETEALRLRLNASETFKLLVDTVKDYAIYMIDRNGFIMTWNAGARRLKQYTEGEVKGASFAMFYSCEDQASGQPAADLRQALERGRSENEGWRYRKDGSRFWANVILTPVYQGNDHIGFAKITQDLTERQAHEESLRLAYETTSRLKSEFLANMSHEIRSPMHGVLSALRLLSDTPLSHEQQELVHIMNDSGSILLRVINDILDYSKLSAGGFSISEETMDLKELVLNTMRAYQSLTKPGVLYTMDIDEHLPDFVRGDAFRIRQVLQNVLSNAIKFTEEGSVHVNVGVEGQNELGPIIKIAVADTGIGILSAEADQLFTPFTQADSSSTKRYQGTGLGLSICRKLIELMGGQIAYQPNSPTGSIFTFTMQLRFTSYVPSIDYSCAIDEPEKQPNRAPSRTMLTRSRVASSSLLPELYAEDVISPASGDISLIPPCRILVVEDNLINQKVLVKMLLKLGYTSVDVAGDGQEGVDLFHKFPKYAAILMDVNLPIMDGIAASKAIRGANPIVPIIALTANALKGDEEALMQQGFMTAYISKPVDMDYLKHLLQKHVDR